MTAKELVAQKLGGMGDDAPPAPADAGPVEPTSSDPVEEAMRDLLSAQSAGDPAGMAAAFRMAMRALEMEPHLEAGEPPAVG